MHTVKYILKCGNTRKLYLCGLTYGCSTLGVHLHNKPSLHFCFCLFSPFFYIGVFSKFLNAVLIAANVHELPTVGPENGLQLHPLAESGYMTLSQDRMSLLLGPLFGILEKLHPQSPGLFVFLCQGFNGEKSLLLFNRLDG